MKIGSAAERLANNRFETDEQENHIQVHQEVVRRTGAADLLVRVCPSRVYSKEADGSVTAEYAACCECGACLAVAPQGALSWRYPRGGMGVQFREG